jgi:hypothetical protein
MVLGITTMVITIHIAITLVIHIMEALVMDITVVMDMVITTDIIREDIIPVQGMAEFLTDPD